MSLLKNLETEKMVESQQNQHFEASSEHNAAGENLHKFEEISNRDVQLESLEELKESGDNLAGSSVDDENPAQMPIIAQKSKQGDTNFG